MLFVTAVCRFNHPLLQLNREIWRGWNIEKKKELWSGFWKVKKKNKRICSFHNQEVFFFFFFRTTGPHALSVGFLTIFVFVFTKINYIYYVIGFKIQGLSIQILFLQ